MFQITCFGWLIFRAVSLHQIARMLYSIIFNMQEPSLKAINFGLTILFHTFLLFFVQIIQKRNKNLLIFQSLPRTIYLTIYFIIFYSILFWGEFGGEQFIYFQF